MGESDVGRGQRRSAEMRVRRNRLSRVPEYKLGLKQIGRTVRSKNRPGARRDCAVCGRWKRIAHGHHLVEIGLVARMLRSIALYDWTPTIPVAFLCPNHHAVWHAMEKDGDAALGDFVREVTADDLEAFARLADERDRARESVMDELRRAEDKFEEEVEEEVKRG